MSKRIRTNLLEILKLFSKKRKEIRVKGNHQFGPTRGENNVFCCNGRRAIRKKTFEGFSLPCWKPSRMEELEINSYSFFFSVSSKGRTRELNLSHEEQGRRRKCVKDLTLQGRKCVVRERNERRAQAPVKKELVLSIV